MKILDKISLRTMLAKRRACKKCLGTGRLLYILPGLDATKFRTVVPCSCIRQIVRVDEDA